MLRFIGRSAAERAKSIAIGLLAGLLTISLWQLSAQNVEATRGKQVRDVAAAVARQFATALTTYDYAHPDVQLVQIAAISCPLVSDRVRSASQDVAYARATSVGAVSDPIVTTVTNSHAEVLVGTSQVVSSIYTSRVAELAGLLEVGVDQTGARWVVSDYRWLVAPGAAP